jgi:hypothetical protein
MLPRDTCRKTLREKITAKPDGILQLARRTGLNGRKDTV